MLLLCKSVQYGKCKVATINPLNDRVSVVSSVGEIVFHGSALAQYV